MWNSVKVFHQILRGKLKSCCSNLHLEWEGFSICKTRFLTYSTKSTFLCIIHNKNFALLKAVFVTENDVFHHCVYLTLWAMKYKLFETGSISSISQTSIYHCKNNAKHTARKTTKNTKSFWACKNNGFVTLAKQWISKGMVNTMQKQTNYRKKRFMQF